MRGKWAIAAAVGLALLAAGCSRLDYNYIREGIGTDIVSPDVAAVTDLQDLYIGEICRQAGLRVSRVGEGYYCDEVSIRPSEWGTFVQAGMNDIDRRCDSYLAWLDNKRRWNEPILKQLHSTAAVTAAIMGLTGVSATPIAIVGAAFGFASETFVNLSGRLITEVNHSVVQTIVLDNQNQFRAKVAGVPTDNRPAAIYLLRNYLRICMPFSIEMSINNTMTVFHRSGAEGLARSEPLLTRGPRVASITAQATRVRSAVIHGAAVPMAPPQRAPIIPDAVRVGAFEQRLLPPAIMNYQRVACLTPDGKFTSATRTTILVWLRTNNKKDPSFPDRITDRDGNRLDEALEAGPRC